MDLELYNYAVMGYISNGTLSCSGKVVEYKLLNAQCN